MRVVVVGTGRCGTKTFIQACKHIKNYTANHESKRLNLPDNHIEADNRLSWIIPFIANKYRQEVLWIFLKRNVSDVARSYLKRKGGVFKNFYCGEVRPQKSTFESAEEFVNAQNMTIKELLKNKNHLTIYIEKPEVGFEIMCKKIGADVDLKSALAEFKKKYNSSKELGL